jgi:hypothetical protein
MNFSLPTDNEAEYEALLHGMRMAKACGATCLDIYGDANLMVQQSMNLCDVVSDNMISYHQMYQSMEAKFEGCELKHIGRASKEEADTLANIGSTCSTIPDGVFYEVINQWSIKVKTLAPPEKSTTYPGAMPKTLSKISLLDLNNKFYSSSLYGLSLSWCTYFDRNYQMIQEKLGMLRVTLMHSL